MEVWSTYSAMSVGGNVLYFGMVLGVDTAGFKLIGKDLDFMVRWKFSLKESWMLNNL